MLKLLKNIIKCISSALYFTVHHDGFEHAGYLSYLIMLTIFPFLVFFVAIVGFMGNNALADILVNLILDSKFAIFIDALKPRIIEITSNPPQSLLTVAILSAIWTASSIFEALRTILNKAYNIVDTPGYLLRRFLSIVEFLAVIIFILLLLTALIILPLLAKYMMNISRHLHLDDIIYIFAPDTELIRAIILSIFAFTLVSGLFYFLPNRKQKWRYIFPGAFLTIAGWSIATSGMRFYLRTFPSINIIYGSIAGVIIALFYFYICALIFIFSAEINYQIEKTLSNNGKKYKL